LEEWIIGNWSNGCCLEDEGAIQNDFELYEELHSFEQRIETQIRHIYIARKKLEEEGFVFKNSEERVIQCEKPRYEKLIGKSFVTLITKEDVQ